MSIITISRGLYSGGKDVAENVAERLGYECIARDALIEAASERFNIPEVKLIRAVNNAPSLIDRFTNGKESYVAYIQATLASLVQKNNVVYHGLAGHFLLQGISHVLKVRITADLEYRIKNAVERDNISEKNALRIIKHDDEQRKKWSRSLYGIDTEDFSLYDLMVFIKDLSVNDAVDIICRAVVGESFQTTTRSQKDMNDLVLASNVKSRLIAMKPDIEVKADDGVISIKTAVQVSYQDNLSQELKNMALSVPGVREVNVETFWTSPYVSDD